METSNDGRDRERHTQESEARQGAQRQPPSVLVCRLRLQENCRYLLQPKEADHSDGSTASQPEKSPKTPVNRAKNSENKIRREGQPADAPQHPGRLIRH